MDEKNDILVSDDEVLQRFGDITKEEYIDPRLLDVKRTRSLLGFWHQIDSSLTDSREGFHLAEKWGDEGLRKQHLDNGRILIKRIKTIEGELRSLLPTIKNVRFLPDNEIGLLPKWMLSLLEIKVEENSS